ncbi:MAG: GNAT family N-acetyltransferase [Cytophagales bacterium]|nr:GNAT family N-acetyltransferase [Cytophagales bacterium]
MKNVDEHEIDLLVEAFFAAFTTTGEHVGNLRNIFDPRGQVTHFQPGETATFHISEFVSSRESILQSGVYQEFKEYELSSKTVIDGNRAVRIATYQKEGIKDGKPFSIKGTKDFQFVKYHTKWKFLSFSWEDHSPQRPVELRLVTEGDAPLLFELMTSEKWLTHIGDRGVYSMNDARQYILDKMHPDLSQKGFVNHVIIDPVTNSAVGTCSLHDREGVDGLDIGYAILEAYEGQGYASSGAQKMIELAFHDYDADKVGAITTDENVVSCRVLEKLGFLHNGYIQLPGSEEQLRYYVIT